MALKGALTDKASHDRITVVENFDAVSGKTKEIVRLLNAAKIDGGAVLVVAGGNIDKVRLACANLQRVEVLPPIGVNVYDLLKSKYVVVDEAGLQGLQGRILEEK
jgi:large subunit ribosomal protein L4